MSKTISDEDRLNGKYCAQFKILCKHKMVMIKELTNMFCM